MRDRGIRVLTFEMRHAERYLGRTYALETELVLVALVLVAWHAIRIPIEGDVATSLAHADDVLGLERALSLDIETWLIASTAAAASTLEWLYTNIHLPVLFAFVAAVRLLAPDRYPLLRTTFMLSFVPAALVIWLYPLAPPHWLPEFGFGAPPTDAELTSTTGALFHNTTAAAASQHFGFALFVAAASIWLFPRSPLAWATIAYPVLAFVVIVGTGNHYVLDCIVGTLTFAFAAVVASRFVPAGAPGTGRADRKHHEHRDRLRADRVGLRLARPHRARRRQRPPRPCAGGGSGPRGHSAPRGGAAGRNEVAPLAHRRFAEGGAMASRAEPGLPGGRAKRGSAGRHGEGGGAWGNHGFPHD